MGKLIVIEGTDSSGKQTQTERIYETLLNEKKNIKKISFPNYSSPACEPVKMYLAGNFGKEATKINPYPVSTMFAIDRYASFKMDWENFYNSDGIIITDRYVTSNMVHQASKISDLKEKYEYLDWLEDLEYNKIGIPKPDLVIFLNMPTEVAIKLMEERKNKITGEDQKDIHESDKEYLKKSYENACEIAKKYNWAEVKCVDGDRLKTREEISKEIYDLVEKLIK
ncbi:MAG: thymidylate kinase [Cetobacterium sp.]|uniref:dTMP kinase n=1 Tax=unclassified Cetobacterium TaxID=2630983 RepID=UPI00163CFCA8|nr:thymidylate kinase [Cetobacterium sp. 2A]MBC2856367.1 thymidylate kinase [Cetobacterium sp. 2A]